MPSKSIALIILADFNDESSEDKRMRQVIENSIFDLKQKEMRVYATYPFEATDGNYELIDNLIKELDTEFANYTVERDRIKDGGSSADNLGVSDVVGISIE